MSNQTSEIIKLDKEDAISLIHQIISEDPDDVQVGILNLLNIDENDADSKTWVSYIIWTVKGYPIHVKKNDDVEKLDIISALKKLLTNKQQKQIGKLCWGYDITKSSSNDDIASEMTGEWLQQRITKADNPNEIQMEYLTCLFNVVLEECKNNNYAPQNAKITISL